MKKDYKFYVYIMSNPKRTVLYIGFTNDLIRRIIEHKYGFGSEFTRKYKLTDLIYHEEYKYADMAIDREKEIKGWRREKKIKLIQSFNSKMLELGKNVIIQYGLNQKEIEMIIKELKNEKYKIKKGYS